MSTMQHSRIRQTPTGFGVIKVDARKQIIVPAVDVPTLAQTATTRLAARTAAPGVAARVSTAQ